MSARLLSVMAGTFCLPILFVCISGGTMRSREMAATLEPTKPQPASRSTENGSTEANVIENRSGKDYRLDLQVIQVDAQLIRAVVTTNFPDHTNIHLWAYRSFLEEGSSEVWCGDIFSRDIPVKNGRIEVQIRINDFPWIMDHRTKKDRLQKLDLWADIDKVLPDIEVRALYSSMRRQPDDVQAVLGKTGELIKRIAGERTSGYIGTFRHAEATIRMSVAPAALRQVELFKRRESDCQQAKARAEDGQHRMGYHIGLTMEGYEFIDEGMSKWQVDQILNCIGVEQSRSGAYVTYLWWKNFKGVTATFESGRLTAKSQSGL